MSALLFFGKSLLFVCCGFLHLQNNLNNGNSSELSNSTVDSNATNIEMRDKFDYPSWVAPPSNRSPLNITHDEVKNNVIANMTESDGAEERNHLVEEEKANVIERFPKASNILQINIFNNGASRSSPFIIKSSNSSDEISRIPLSMSEEPLPNINPTLSSLEPSALYAIPKETATNKELPWWKTSIIYQIYPRSFKDSDNSGTGDLEGISEKVDYLKKLGIGAVWISPVYVSPMADFGYDVADFKDIDPIFGSLNEFDAMLKNLHSRNIKLIMDFIPNHSSDKHTWFKKSIENIEPYADYYVWEDAIGYLESGEPIPPNNWLSVFGGSAWEWSPERKQFYMHQFLKEQPDLNVRNPLVMQELDNILKFWLDRSVDGFRVDALKHLFEVENVTLADEPRNENSNVKDAQEYGYLNHTFSVNQPETVEAVNRWRRIIDEYPDRVMIVEVYDDNEEEITKYYETSSERLAHFPFNFHLITELQNRSDVTGFKLREIVDSWIEGMPSKDNWPNWVLGNHDRGRVASRLGKDLVDALNMLLLLLPGTPTTYYGEEIGMEDNYISYEDAKDPFGIKFGPERYTEFGRDPQRTPMQWDDTEFAGFSKANFTWLPVHSNHKHINVESQESNENSHLKVYSRLAQLRSEPTFRKGNYSFPLVLEDVLALKRSLNGEPSYLLLINTSKGEINLVDEHPEQTFQKGEVIIRSSFDNRSQTIPGSVVHQSSLSLLPGEGIVLKV